MLLRLFQLLSVLPLPLMHAVGVVAGWAVYAVSPTYRRRMRDNLQRAGYLHLLPAAIAEAGKGAIFLTPHLGCFEIIAQAIASRTPLTALYRPPRKSALRPLLEQARSREGLALAPANLAGVRTLLKRLKGGGAIGLLPDQAPGAGEGVWTEFFGRAAYTMTLPAKMQQMSGAPLVLSYAERLPRGRGFAVRFVRFERTLEGTPEQQARMINEAMEELIARCPAQYFWSYNRYKGKPPVVVSGEAA